MAVTAPSTFTVPALKPRPYGLDSVATITPAQRIVDGVQYEWPDTGPTVSATSEGTLDKYCISTELTDIGALDQGLTAAFTHEAQRECSMLGGNDYAGQAMAVLNLTRSRVLEARLSEIAAGTADSGLTIITDSEQGVDNAIAAAQQKFADATSVQGTVHVSPAGGAMLHEHFRLAGDHLETKIGNLLEVGDGITDGVFIVTGPVFVQEGQARTYGPEPTIADNTEVVRVARDYLMEVVGPVVVVTVT